MERKPLFSVTRDDCRWNYYNGSGKGGQNRNKRSNCVRCFHDPSGAMGKSEDERDQAQNKKLAFKRMTDTKEFRDWIRMETMKQSGVLDYIEKKVEEEIKKVKTEVKDENGRWTEVVDIVEG